MKKKAWLAVALAIVMCFFLVACGKKEKLIEATGSSTIMENVKGTPDDFQPKDVAYVVAGKLKGFDSYKVTTSGTAVAKKGFINYSQQIDNLTVKNGEESFIQAVSNSALVKMKHQAFTKNNAQGKVAHRNSDKGDITTSTRDSYLNTYGLTPDNEDILNLVFNKDSILFAEQMSTPVAGQYLYRFVLDPVESTAGVRRQMIEYGGLSDVPEFSSAEVQLKIDKNWMPIDATLTAQYTISKAVIGKMSCTQTLTSKYSDINKTVTIPDSAAFNKALGTTPSTVHPTEVENDPVLEGLMNAMLDYDVTRGIALTGTTSATVLGKAVSLPLNLTAKIDLDKLTAESVDALSADLSTSIVGLPLELHLQKGTVYVRVGDEKMKGKLGTTTFGSFEDAIKLTKVSDGYLIALSDKLTATVNTAMKPYGLALQTAAVKLEVGAERVSSASLQLVVASAATHEVLVTVASNVLLAECAYIAPNLADYTDEARTFGATVNVHTSMFGLIPVDLTADVQATLDPKTLFGGNFNQAISASVKIDMRGLSGVLGFMGDLLPEGISDVNLYLKDGKLYTVMFADADKDGESVAISVSETELSKTGGFDLSGLLGAQGVSALDYLTQHLEIDIADQIVVRANEEMLADFQKLWVEKLVPFIAKSAGDSMGMLVDTIFTQVKWTEISLSVSTDPFALTLNVKSDMLPITVSITQKTEIDATVFDRFDENVAMWTADVRAAAEFDRLVMGFAIGTKSYNGYEWTQMSLFDAVAQQIDAANAIYDSLTLQQQKIVFPAKTRLDKFVADRASLLSGVQAAITEINTSFAKMNKSDSAAWTKINTAFDAKADCVRAFIANDVSDYLTARVAYEQPAISTLASRMTAFCTAMEAATDYDTLCEAFDTATAIDADFALLCADSQKAMETVYADYVAARDEMVVKTIDAFATECEEIIIAMNDQMAMEIRPSDEEIVALQNRYNAVQDRFTILSDKYFMEFTKAAIAGCDDSMALYEGDYIVFVEKNKIEEAKALAKAYTEKYDALMNRYSITATEFKTFKEDYKQNVEVKLLQLSGAAKTAAGYTAISTKYKDYKTFMQSLTERELGVVSEELTSYMASENMTVAEAKAMRTKANAAVELFDSYKQEWNGEMSVDFDMVNSTGTGMLAAMKTTIGELDALIDDMTVTPKAA